MYDVSVKFIFPDDIEISEIDISFDWIRYHGKSKEEMDMILNRGQNWHYDTKFRIFH